MGDRGRRDACRSVGGQEEEKEGREGGQAGRPEQVQRFWAQPRGRGHQGHGQEEAREAQEEDAEGAEGGQAPRGRALLEVQQLWRRWIRRERLRGGVRGVPADEAEV